MDRGTKIKRGTKRAMEVAAKLPPLVDDRLRAGRAPASASAPAAPAEKASGLTAAR